MLDSRKERPLTSREIAKIIGGIIGGALGSGADPDHLLVTMRSARQFLQGRQHVGLGPTPTTLVAGAIGGLFGALLSWCHIDDVRVAVEWICYHWTEVVTSVLAADRSTVTPN